MKLQIDQLSFFGPRIMHRRRHVGRPQHSRWIKQIPKITRFKPSGVPAKILEQIQLTIDELEAIRLADLKGSYHKQTAEKMKVSRQTFGRIINSAHKKVAEALVLGKSILIEGGTIMPIGQQRGLGAIGYCICPKCEEKIPPRRGILCLQERCPKCGSKMIREGSFHHNLYQQKKREREMNVAISSTDKTLGSDIDPRFGRCLYFIIVDPYTMKYRAYSNENAAPKGGAGIRASQFIVDLGAEAVITGNMGPNAFETLNTAGIEILTDAEGTVRDAIERYLEGKLKKAQSPTIGVHSGLRNHQ